ncbi:MULTISPECIES: hypothetical protein [unclassified Sphingomonas]|uniref:hypothetical protein n=1 Tax=unclassified Sphingomonas TaxID=196159 RepID=UPI00226A6956|nr:MULTISPECIES: hypothetical protein [unclassified Sphingomonas]
MLACLFLGDSIAADTAARLRAALQDRCAIVARKGANTPAITLIAPAALFYTAVLSSGSNDGGRTDLGMRLDRLRLSVSARYVLWIVPYDRRAAQLVRWTAAQHGDNVVDLAGLATRDRIHPSSYEGLAYALRRGGYAGPR